MAANVEKSPLIRFVDELDFKQIPVSVKRKKKEECPSGLILIDSNCELKKVESSSESSSGEKDELEGENNSDQDQTSSSCSESGETSKRKAEGYNICEIKFQKKERLQRISSQKKKWKNYVKGWKVSDMILTVK